MPSKLSQKGNCVHQNLSQKGIFLTFSAVNFFPKKEIFDAYIINPHFRYPSLMAHKPGSTHPPGLLKPLGEGFQHYSPSKTIQQPGVNYPNSRRRSPGFVKKVVRTTALAFPGVRQRLRILSRSFVLFGHSGIPRSGRRLRILSRPFFRRNTSMRL